MLIAKLCRRLNGAMAAGRDNEYKAHKLLQNQTITINTRKIVGTFTCFGYGILVKSQRFEMMY